MVGSFRVGCAGRLAGACLHQPGAGWLRGRRPAGAGVGNGGR